MAANFWASSHCKQLLDQEDVDVVHPLDKEKGLTLEEFKLIKIHMSNHISKFGERVKVQQRLRTLQSRSWIFMMYINLQQKTE
ncbi:unnamed protein product [Victoria cruziana]